ncbi:hypothetical protein UPYG_G00221530 [Umbra pygmaea]|uniref:Exocyst complex component 3 n=1 Tax=Umbra pygmaea TaxID=75934 RepID=A0ABD0WCF9_UMBPY
MAGIEEAGDMAEMNNTQALELDMDGSSLKSPSERNGNSQSEGLVKEKKPGMIKQLKESIRRVGERSPLASSSKGSSDKPDSIEERHSIDPEVSSLTHPLPTPASPSLSTGSLTSPLKSFNGSFFQSKEGEERAENSPTPQKKLSRTHSDTSGIGESLLKKGASIRRSLRLVGNKILKPDLLLPVAEITVENERERVEEREKGKTEVRESYTLPEIPPTPLSVMQISKMIEMEQLEEAHVNLLSLRLEFQHEQEECTEEASSVELAKKEKDLSILYSNLQGKVKEIVRESSKHSYANIDLLLPVARIIQEEEKREADPGGVGGPGGWRGTWREAVSEGVQASLSKVTLDSPEQSASWLAVHLGLLGKAITEDLEMVKGELQRSYPHSFNVFSTYLNCYHHAVGQHLKKLQLQVAELKDYYVLLDWIINYYESEEIMGSPSLRPEMEAENTGLSLEKGFLEQLKEKYCLRAKEDMRASLDKILELENEDMWSKKLAPETDEDKFFNSEIHMDIWTKVKSNAVNSKKIDANLETRVVCSCLQELQQFPKRFEDAFRNSCNILEDPLLWAKYQITYINSFTALKDHMEGYRESCPEHVDHHSREVDDLVHRLVQGLEEHFKNDVKSYLRRMMTSKWLSTDEDFQQLYNKTETLSQHCLHMRPPYVKMLVSGVHYYIVKEYVSQLMKNNYSCKNRKHEIAASTMRLQWDRLNYLFDEMKTTQDWLHPVGQHLSDIIGKNEGEIKIHLKDLVTDYPDISKKHLLAVLYFRGLRGREKRTIVRYFTELKKKLEIKGSTGEIRRALFSEIQVTNTNTNCLTDMPFSCFSFLSPDS